MQHFKLFKIPEDPEKELVQTHSFYVKKTFKDELSLPNCPKQTMILQQSAFGNNPKVNSYNNEMQTLKNLSNFDNHIIEIEVVAASCCFDTKLQREKFWYFTSGNIFRPLYFGYEHLSGY